MIVEITRLPEPYFVKSRGLHIRDRFTVQGLPRKTVHRNVEKVGYMIFPDKGNAIVLYDDEAKVLN